MHVDDDSCYHHDENDVGDNLNELNSVIVISLVLLKYSGDSLLIKRMLTLKVVQALLSPSMPFLESEFCNLSFFSLSFIYYYPLTPPSCNPRMFSGRKTKEFYIDLQDNRYYNPGEVVRGIQWKSACVCFCSL